MTKPPGLFPAAGIRAFRISPNDTVKLAVLSGPSTGSSATVVFEIWDPGGAQPPNSHPDSAETFVVLRGTGIAYSDEHSRALKAGDTLVLPAGSTHRIVNSSPTERMYAITVMADDGGFEELITRGTAASLEAADLALLLGESTAAAAS